MTIHAYSCSVSCQTKHVHCKGCGVLEGPQHDHTLNAQGYCQYLWVGEAWQELRGGCFRKPQPACSSCFKELRAMTADGLCGYCRYKNNPENKQRRRETVARYRAKKRHE